jgi:N-acetylmuramoyl-L-alanine amidase
MKTLTRYALLGFLLLGSCGLSVRAFETVVIDAGHGGNDEGTKWYHVAEKDITLAVAKRLEKILREKGIHVVQTRSDDSYMSLIERAEVANAAKHSLLVSIHFNSSRINPAGASGFQTYHFLCSPSSRIVADSIQDAMAEKLIGRNRGVHKNDFAVLTRTNDLAVLVECGFISNKAEAMYFNSESGQQALAEALATGILRVKPVVNNDPPATFEAKAALIAKRDAAAERKLLLSGAKKPGKLQVAPAPSWFAVAARAPARNLLVSISGIMSRQVESTVPPFEYVLRGMLAACDGALGSE